MTCRTVDNIENWNTWHFETGESFQIALKLFYMQFRITGMYWNFWFNIIYESSIDIPSVSATPSPLSTSLRKVFCNYLSCQDRFSLLPIRLGTYVYNLDRLTHCLHVSAEMI